jgi:hypothetical protein
MPSPFSDFFQPFAEQVTLATRGMDQFARGLQQIKNLQFTESIAASAKGLKSLGTAADRALGQMQQLTSSIGGGALRPLTQAFELLGSTIGVVVLPAVTVLAAGLAATADVMMAKLKPYAEAFGEALVSLIPAVGKAADAALEFAKWAARDKRGPGQAAAPADPALRASSP